MLIFGYVLGGLTGLWCVHRLLICVYYASNQVKKKIRLQAELDLIQPSLTAQPQHNPHQPAFADALEPTSGANCQYNAQRGAYANSKNFIPNSVGSVSSSSIVLSSLHSSEVSGLIYDEYSGQSASNSNNSQSQQTKSWESIMEEGVQGDAVDSDSESVESWLPLDSRSEPTSIVGSDGHDNNSNDVGEDTNSNFCSDESENCIRCTISSGDVSSNRNRSIDVTRISGTMDDAHLVSNDGESKSSASCERGSCER